MTDDGIQYSLDVPLNDIPGIFEQSMPLQPVHRSPQNLATWPGQSIKKESPSITCCYSSRASTSWSIWSNTVENFAMFHRLQYQQEMLRIP
ncbi:hypothetical protein ElyMa_006193100 [Elysia marginata]|uniref:Uncharacterized protein n=1 Tax=Elysia marginata TaxID=1093978 RepID=A0AAV4H336_9GAST|nr:hypothetical protein ElyMa_006193100 [Elysia marginata]